MNINAQNREIDSLQTLLKSGKSDTSQVNILNNLSELLRNFGQNEKSLFYSKQAFELAEKLNYKKGVAISYENIGIVFEVQGFYEKSLENYLASLKIYEDIKDLKGIGDQYNNIGIIYLYLNNNNKALENFFKSKKIRTEIDDKKGIAGNYTNIGLIYEHKRNYDTALTYYFNTLKIYMDLGNKRGITDAYILIGNVYFEKGDYNQALDNYTKSLKIKTEIGDKLGIISCKVNMGSVYVKQNKLENAYQYLSEGLSLLKETGNKNGIKEVYLSLVELFEIKHDYKQAFQFQKLYSDIKDTLLNEESSKQIAEMNTKYDTEKKDKEIIKKDAEIIVQHAQSAKQKTQRNAFIIGFLLMIGFAFFIFKSYRQKKKANVLLEIKNETISQQNVEIEKKNTVITDSIEYAQNIQQAILPEEDEIKRVFTNYFVFYKPKDIVSGDFYWLHADEQRILFAVADCTGHGVPGAFMSFMGYNLLENIINTSSALSPSGILEELNSQILLVLKQKDQSSSAKFGMDISLIAIDKQSNMLEFSGAHNSMCISRKDEFTELKADKRSIGSFKKDKQKDFTNHRFQLTEGDVLYMFTDGYHDQIGGPENKKYFSSVFKDLLKANSGFTFQDQKEILTQTILDWKGNKPQTDDMLVVGIKI